MLRPVLVFAAMVLVAVVSPPRSARAQDYLHGSTSLVSSCTGTYYDSGGATGAYSNGESSTMTFCNPGSGSIQVTFTTFDVESSYDSLDAYDGSDTLGTLIGSFDGTTSPGTLTGTGGCITFQFTSDSSVTRNGWAATLSCGGSVDAGVDAGGGGFDAGGGGFDAGGGGFDAGGGGFDAGSGRFDAGSGGFDAGSGGFDAGSGGFDAGSGGGRSGRGRRRGGCSAVGGGPADLGWLLPVAVAFRVLRRRRRV